MKDYRENCVNFKSWSQKRFRSWSSHSSGLCHESVLFNTQRTGAEEKDSAPDLDFYHGQEAVQPKVQHRFNSLVSERKTERASEPEFMDRGVFGHRRQ